MGVHSIEKRGKDVPKCAPIFKSLKNVGSGSDSLQRSLMNPEDVLMS